MADPASHALSNDEGGLGPVLDALLDAVVVPEGDWLDEARRRTQRLVTAMDEADANRTAR
jgi:hypothetical protein